MHRRIHVKPKQPRTALALLVLLIGLCLSACNAPATSSQMGFALSVPDGPVRWYLSGDVPATGMLYVKWLTPDGRGNCCASVPSANLQKLDPFGDTFAATQLPDSTPEPMRGLSLDAHTVTYTPRHPLPELAADAIVGIAVSSDPAALQRVRLRLCFGEEGIHLMATEPASGSQPERHRAQYLGLGYAIDETPRCGTQDLQRINAATGQ